MDEKELLGHDEHEDELLKESPSPDASDKKHGHKPKHSASSITSSTSIDMAAESTTPQALHKKISLKRNLSVPKPVLPETSTTIKPTSDDEKAKSSISSTNGGSENADEPDKKIVKLTELSSEERLKLRAQKFGASAASTDVVSDDRKLARAARFGITSTTTTTGGSSASIKSSAPEVSVEILKKRAERFGASTAPKLNAIELDEKLKKRQERFGVSAGSTLPSDQAEKAKLRLERFKTAA